MRQKRWITATLFPSHSDLMTQYGISPTELVRAALRVRAGEINTKSRVSITVTPELQAIFHTVKAAWELNNNNTVAYLIDEALERLSNG